MSPIQTTKKTLLAEAPVQLVLLLLAGVVLSWPIIQLVGEGGAAVFFVYVFVVWAGLVLLLGLIGRAIARRLPAAVPSARADEGER